MFSKKDDSIQPVAPTISADVNAGSFNTKNIQINGSSYSNVPAIKVKEAGKTNSYFNFYAVDDTDATASSVLASKKFHLSDGSVATGNIPTKTSSDVEVSGQNVIVVPGYYGITVNKSVESGTINTPTAQKTISGHTATITPKVEAETGYVTGGTFTGTPVSVSASDLVSGDKTITVANTSVDVSNYKYAHVSAASATAEASVSPVQQGTFTIVVTPKIKVTTGGFIDEGEIPGSGNSIGLAPYIPVTTYQEGSETKQITADMVLDGKTVIVNDGHLASTLLGTMPHNFGDITITGSGIECIGSDVAFYIPENGYYDKTQEAALVASDSNLVNAYNTTHENVFKAENIKNGVSIMGVTGTFKNADITQGSDGVLTIL